MSAAIYRRAAECVVDPTFDNKDNGDYGSCEFVDAAEIEMCGIEGYINRASKYADLFCPSDYDEVTEAYWGDLWGDAVERKECRILALCFMAAIVEAGNA